MFMSGLIRFTFENQKSCLPSNLIIVRLTETIQKLHFWFADIGTDSNAEHVEH